MTQEKHWLVRPKSIRNLWVGFIVVLVITIIPDFVIDHHEEFGVDGTVGFNAWFGFICCAAMVLVAKVLGKLIKRKDTYYD